jgi:ankyrin repeat protein
MSDRQGQTVLHHAASLGRTPVVKYLLEHGARTDLKDDAGKTALDAARGEAGSQPGRQEIVTLLSTTRARD